MKENFQTLINNDTPTLIDFSAEWCGPCKMMAPILEQLKGMMGEQVRIIKIDVDRNPAIASALQIQGVPTLALFRKGKMLWRQSGVIPAQQLAEIVKRNIAGV
jgi:thioredoxin 1